MSRSTRWLLGPLAAVALLAPSHAQAAAADSSQYWLAPYIQGGWISPSPPPAGELLTLTLVGVFPYDCGEIADTNVVATHVEFTMRQASAGCADTARSWRLELSLGSFSSGLHTITVVRRLERDGNIEVWTPTFEIAVGEVPPPPQPTCPLFSHFTTSPDPAHEDTATVVTLHGCFPWSCGEFADSRLLGPTRVEVTLRQTSGCTDSVSSWHHTVDLGLLAAGSYNLIVDVKDEATPHITQMFGTWLTVVGDSFPPPPPPPPPPATGPLFSHSTTTPNPAATNVPIVLNAYGFFPYACGFVSDAEVVSPSEVRLTLRRGAECPGDTTRVWARSFALGLLPPGAHQVLVRVRDAGVADSLAVHDFTTSFEVWNLGPPTPPPPPGDSLLASVPNPFEQSTRFGVVIEEEVPVSIAVLDIQGRVVRNLYRGTMASGSREFVWDGRSDGGEKLGAGVYFYRLVRPGRTLSRRIVLLGAK